MNPQKPTDADFEIQITTQPRSKILYWAAEPANQDLHFITNWQNAYLDFTNAGVTIADYSGKATLYARKPQSYAVPIKGILQPHIHYRVCENGGMIGPVQTVTFDGKEYFENVVSAQENPEPVLNSPPAPKPPFPETALHRLNEQAAHTARMSRMIQTGALDEFRPSRMGASLEYAFPN